MSGTKFIFAAVFGAAIALTAGVAAADNGKPPQHVGNAAAGKEKSATCQECHGEDGNSVTAGYPKLAGQNAAYLLKQLHNFRAGERKNPLMDLMAARIEEADLPDIVAYFSSQKLNKNESANGDAAGRALAKNLFEKGDKARNLASCMSCHGVDGKGAVIDGVSSPAIGGQDKFYLREQLRNWNLGYRSNSPGVMNTIGKALSDEEIEALAVYVSGL